MISSQSGLFVYIMWAKQVHEYLYCVICWLPACAAYQPYDGMLRQARRSVSMVFYSTLGISVYYNIPKRFNQFFVVVYN